MILRLNDTPILGNFNHNANRYLLQLVFEVVKMNEATGSLIMHGELETDADFIILASDTPAPMPFDPGARISLAIFGDNEFKMAECYNALLSQGGSTQMPLEKAPWGDSFGMVTDRYGVNWMFNISGANHGD